MRIIRLLLGQIAKSLMINLGILTPTIDYMGRLLIHALIIILSDTCTHIKFSLGAQDLLGHTMQISH